MTWAEPRIRQFLQLRRYDPDVQSTRLQRRAAEQLGNVYTINSLKKRCIGGHVSPCRRQRPAAMVKSGEQQGRRPSRNQNGDVQLEQ